MGEKMEIKEEVDLVSNLNYYEKAEDLYSHGNYHEALKMFNQALVSLLT